MERWRDGGKTNSARERERDMKRRVRYLSRYYAAASGRSAAEEKRTFLSCPQVSNARCRVLYAMPL